MAEEFGFFDPVEIAPDVWDREYNAEQFTRYFRALVTTGIMKGETKELKVSANGANMVVAIDTGVAFIEGGYYRNTDSLPHTLDTESLGRSRIDRIVARLDMAERKVNSVVKKGVPSASPTAPVLTQTANLYEISLAQVKVVGGQTYVNVTDVVDERGKDVICPWAGSNILPNFDDAALGDLIIDVSGKADKTQEEWISASLENGWTGNVKYYKDEFDTMHVYGQLNNPGTQSGLFTTLPVGYRINYGNPISSVMFSVFGNTSTEPKVVTINVNYDGRLLLVSGQSNTTQIRLDFSYRIER